MDFRRAKYCGSERPTGAVTEDVLDGDGKPMLIESWDAPNSQFGTHI